ncbi:MAG TPA: hypothetical protein VD997_09605 [Phycisphaerales bacterium]|nr:hypothetical protein [Phycisphaerales bacterium]
MSLFGGGDADKPSLAQEDQLLIEAYQAAGRTLDDLPYTPEFETLYAAAGEPAGRDRRSVFHRLHNLRKAGKLPRMGRASEPAPKVTPEDEALLTRLVVDQVGTLGQRDQLPFDARFDHLVQAFCERTGRTMSQRDVWRLVAKLAK